MKDYKDEQTLRQLYNKYNSQEDIAEVCNCHQTTIKNWMEKFGIKTTDSHSNVRDRDFTPVEHKPNTTCKFCESEFWRKPSNKDGKNFCNMDCYGKWMSENRTGKNHPQYDRVEVECNNCGCTFEIIRSHHKKVDNHYCDHDCQVEHENREGSNNPSWKGGKKSVECHYCGSELKKYPYRYEEEDHFFCNHECRGKWFTEERSNENHPLWEGYSEDYGEDWLVMRNQTRERDDGTCQKCGVGKDELGQWPDVHHIEPVNSFDDPNEANFLENLICLCSSCHGKVEQGKMKSPKPIQTQ